MNKKWLLIPLFLVAVLSPLMFPVYADNEDPCGDHLCGVLIVSHEDGVVTVKAITDDWLNMEGERVRFYFYEGKNDKGPKLHESPKLHVYPEGDFLVAEYTFDYNPYEKVTVVAHFLGKLYSCKSKPNLIPWFTSLPIALLGVTACVIFLTRKRKL